MSKKPLSAPRLTMPTRTLLDGAPYVRGPSILQAKPIFGTRSVYDPANKCFVEVPNGSRSKPVQR